MERKTLVSQPGTLNEKPQFHEDVYKQNYLDFINKGRTPEERKQHEYNRLHREEEWNDEE
jgi:hypothetical protein